MSIKESNTIDQIVSELIDGLNMDFDDVKQRLVGLWEANQWSLKELRDLCWEDSALIFDMIM